MTAPFTALDPSDSRGKRLADINSQIHIARTLQWNYSQMQRASGVFRMERLLEDLYAEKDAILAEVRA